MYNNHSVSLKHRYTIQRFTSLFHWHIYTTSVSREWTTQINIYEYFIRCYCVYCILPTSIPKCV
jgi:hypothetical protein